MILVFKIILPIITLTAPFLNHVDDQQRGVSQKIPKNHPPGLRIVRLKENVLSFFGTQIFFKKHFPLKIFFSVFLHIGFRSNNTSKYRHTKLYRGKGMHFLTKVNKIYTRVIKFLRIFEFRNWHLMRGWLMLPDSISDEKLIKK